MDAAAPDYTVVLTSCGRFDLLAETLKSLIANLDVPPAKIIVIEDSGDAAVKDVCASMNAPIEVLINRPQLGQMRAIDKAYGAVATPYVFHCEDDWQFTRSGFIRESHVVLEACPDVSMVGLRPRSELNPRVRDLPSQTINGVGAFLYDPTRHPEYFGYSFNPGLRRLADYHRFAPFADVGHEPEVSLAFKQAGFRMANLDEPAAVHIGEGRHVDEPGRPKRPTTIIGRWQRSFEKRVDRFKRWRAS